MTDTAPYYTIIDILVLPTYREGFPNTPLEAAAMQLPVVASAVDGCVEAMSMKKLVSSKAKGLKGIG